VRRPVIAGIWGPGGVRLLLGDALVLAAIAAAVIALSLPGADGGRAHRAEVEASGRIVATIDLTREAVHEIKGALGVTRLEARGGRVRVLSSPCPRQACRHGGWIGKAGEMLVCLPNEVVVRLPGRRPDAPDAVSR